MSRIPGCTCFAAATCSGHPGCSRPRDQKIAEKSTDENLKFSASPFRGSKCGDDIKDKFVSSSAILSVSQDINRFRSKSDVRVAAWSVLWATMCALAGGAKGGSKRACRHYPSRINHCCLLGLIICIILYSV